MANPESRISTRWITGKNYDLLWYIGACVTSYILLYLNLAVGISALFLWWFWIVSVDGPHVFGTISRTYLDAEEWHQRARLLTSSLLWFLAGPLFLLAAFLAGQEGESAVMILNLHLWTLTIHRAHFIRFHGWHFFVWVLSFIHKGNQRKRSSWMVQ